MDKLSTTSFASDNSLQDISEMGKDKNMELPPGSEHLNLEGEKFASLLQNPDNSENKEGLAGFKGEENKEPVNADSLFFTQTQNPQNITEAMTSSPANNLNKNSGGSDLIETDIADDSELMENTDIDMSLLSKNNLNNINDNNKPAFLYQDGFNKNSENLKNYETVPNQQEDNTENSNPFALTDKDVKDTQETRNDSDEISQNTNTTGDSILGSFFKEKNIDSSQSVTNEKPPVNINEIAEKIADRILISTQNQDGSNEIRIQVKQDILPDTEIQITKTGDQININFITSSNESMDLLNTHTETLFQNLNNRLDEKVTIQINSSESSSQDSDGRSRQQRNLYDEMEE